MVTIIDAFDAMTTDHVYRRALSRERAIAELFEYAGTQFDPHLVRKFCTFISTDQARLQEVAVRRWLTDLRPEEAKSFWKLGQAEATTNAPRENFFQQHLLDTMADAVVFVDSSLQILYWNRAAERLTGIGAEAVVHFDRRGHRVAGIENNMRRGFFGHGGGPTPNPYPGERPTPPFEPPATAHPLPPGRDEGSHGQRADPRH